MEHAGVHSNWFAAACVVPGEEESGLRLMLLPTTEVKHQDNWRAAGMAGTATNIAAVNEVFVPAARTANVKDLADGTYAVLDICRDLDSPTYPGATESDLAETVKAIEHADRAAFARTADVRDYEELQRFVAEAVDVLGPIDIVSVNAGIFGPGSTTWDIDPKQWREVIDINLTGAFNTVRAVLPQMLQAGNGGSIVFTSSAVGIRAVENLSDYVASKFGVIGLMKTMALELGRHKVRVNAVCPTLVGTDMIFNEGLYELFRPDLQHPSLADVEPVWRANNVLNTPWVEDRRCERGRCVACL
jgi:NAD(P)-dependent dehydrogenase (short-subunit alcohol dehydrogenase family)